MNDQTPEIAQSGNEPKQIHLEELAQDISLHIDEAIEFIQEKLPKSAVAAGVKVFKGSVGIDKGQTLGIVLEIPAGADPSLSLVPQALNILKENGLANLSIRIDHLPLPPEKRTGEWHPVADNWGE